VAREVRIPKQEYASWKMFDRNLKDGYEEDYKT
jgi:hypothetical protein